MILKAQHKSILVLIWHTWVSILGHCSPTKVSGKLKDTCSPKGFRCVWGRGRCVQIITKGSDGGTQRKKKA